MANARVIDYRDLVNLHEEESGEATTEHKAYEFTNRTFYEDDDSGVYGEDE